MRWVDATPDPAQMIEFQAIRHRTVEIFPVALADSDTPPLAINLFLFLSVAAVSGSGPDPTTALINKESRQVIAATLIRDEMALLWQFHGFPHHGVCGISRTPRCGRPCGI